MSGLSGLTMDSVMRMERQVGPVGWRGMTEMGGREVAVTQGAGAGTRAGAGSGGGDPPAPPDVAYRASRDAQGAHTLPALQKGRP